MDGKVILSEHSQCKFFKKEGTTKELAKLIMPLLKVEGNFCSVQLIARDRGKLYQVGDFLFFSGVREELIKHPRRSSSATFNKRLR